MKIVIPRSELLDCVNKVKTVVSAKSALPILSQLLFEAEDNQLKISATDLKVSIECTVDCSVKRAGALTVPAQRLASVLAELPNEDIRIELGDNNIVSIECGRSDAKLFSMAAEEFPPVRSFEGVEPVVLDQALLKKLFGKTSFAICMDQARHNLTGLLFEAGNGKLTVVATDGRRMTLCIEKDSIPDGINMKAIIPQKMIAELERLLSDEGEVKVTVDESGAGFAFGNIRLVTALIDGAFPNYETVVPKKHDKEVVVDTSVLREAVRRARVMTNEKFNSVRFGVKNGEMSLKVQTPEVGEYNEDFGVEYDGGALEVAFNPDFVHDVLRHIDTEKTAFILKDAMSPCLLKPWRDAPNDSYISIIMPIRI